MKSIGAYVLVTPARNEEDHVERVIRSVVDQTVRPLRYVVVSDGSTDRTDEIVADYAARYDFITFVRSGDEGDRKGFGSKVLAFNAGYEKLHGLDYDFIGNLDADVSFPPDYFEKLLARFALDAEMGLSGGAILEMIDGVPKSRGASRESVPGAVQLFRRACFEEIGGYRPLSRGGIDAGAEIMARAKGWRVRQQADLEVVTHRPVMTGNSSPLAVRFNKGVQNRYLGYHPLFQFAVAARYSIHRPYLLGGLSVLAGYFVAMMRGTPMALPDDVIAYLRTEQLARLGLKSPPANARPASQLPQSS